MAVRVVFSFPPFHGHLNPSLPIASKLVNSGHDVHYLSSETVKSKIEATGATFHSAHEHQPEFYSGRLEANNPLGPLEDLFEELGLSRTEFLSQLQTLNIVLEKQLPGAIRFLQILNPDVIVYDTLLRGRDLQHAAQLLRIPAVGLHTLAGPGAWITHSPVTMWPLTLSDADEIVANFQPNLEATERLNEQYGLALSKGLPQPEGKMDTFGANAVLVTTSEELQDPLSSELATSYAQDAANFIYVGPLLQDVIRRRAEESVDPLLARVQDARDAMRPIVMVSMGTLLVSNHSLNGWNGRSGNGRSLSGCELVRAVWGAAFNACGTDAVDTGPLVVVSLGSQPDPLGDVKVPPNAICVPSLPQVDILRQGVDVLITHGGQNSFVEAIAHDTPMVVCPGFGDQIVNASKAERLGLGLKVDRPQAAHGEELHVADQYQRDVCRAILEVRSGPKFKEAAAQCGDRLRKTGGVSQAVAVVLQAAKTHRIDHMGCLADGKFQPMNRHSIAGGA